MTSTPSSRSSPAADLADWGEPDNTEQDLRHDWRFPQLDLASDTWLAERDGGVRAYAWLLARDEHRDLNGWFVVHPDDRGLGVEPWLLDGMERRAGEHAMVAPSGDAVLMRVGTIGPDTDTHALLASRGYEQARSFCKMSVRLEPPVTRPPLPDGVVVRALGSFDPADPERIDPRVVHATYVEAFAGHWGWVAPTFDEWTIRTEFPDGVDPALWLVAFDGDEPVGVALCSDDEGRGYVETLGVRPAWQGRGIGGALLRWAFAAFAERGLLDVDLGVDSENPTGAMGLYERAGMHVTRRYDVFERRLTGSGPSRASASTA